MQSTLQLAADWPSGAAPAAIWPSVHASTGAHLRIVNKILAVLAVWRQCSRRGLLQTLDDRGLARAVVPNNECQGSMKVQHRVVIWAEAADARDLHSVHCCHVEAVCTCAPSELQLGLHSVGSTALCCPMLWLAFARGKACVDQLAVRKPCRSCKSTGSLSAEQICIID